MEYSGCMVSVTVVLVFLLSCFCSEFGAAIDTITSSQSITDPETITSIGGTFKLGFFSPGNSTDRYVGIWYSRASGNAVIWVANRNKPLINDSSGIVTIYDDGNLVVLNGQKDILWSSNVSNSVTNASAQLSDSGNLVLNAGTPGLSIWESFQEPTDSLLPGMRISTNVRTAKKVQLTSWKSPSDPSVGSFSCSLKPLNVPDVFIWNDSRPYWRTGPWNGRIFNGVPGMDSLYLDGFNIEVNDPQGNSYLTYAFVNITMYLVLTSQGFVEERDWEDGKNDWEDISFWKPKSECDIYGWCGPFGICNSQKKTICSCSRGFEPMNIEEWNRGYWTGGCVRRKPLKCERIKKTGEVGKEDGFLKLEKMKLPDFAERSSGFEDECRVQCLRNCSCVAYAYDVGIGCMQWRGNLIDMQKFSLEVAVLYIRVAHSELDKEVMKVVIVVPVIVGTVAITICAIFSWRWTTKRKAMKKKWKVQQLDECQTYNKLSPEIMNPSKLQDLTLINFEELATATNGFHLKNKLGQGGFGPVYMGKLQDGQEIAVKRLSRESGQGLDEFMNEIMVISKLQHRNLVRLLGCCIEGEEKMLIYEYMPNRSLDTFLFDPLKREHLDWRKRFNIIEGISRDEELNPKISDFGTAKIFGGNQDQAKTGRVVGTYGYMSPEYAMEGRFSEKSDVFSFGVLLLEIVSGRRNASFYHEEGALNLLSHAWKLWTENNIATLIDPVISESGLEFEIIRCIHVGLLCVQEFVKDRPTMPTVISMLSTENVDLPTPKLPAFTERQRCTLHTDSYEQNQERCSGNNVTVTDIEAR
ncbi:G-type lectin S-receptor-like serine/threonine-protein kinase [Melia azedarach]|uniref:G-type lectin S-receptor-like serine/threonine-protein kinase n=1 Tax=Melia azedarach TaxID=155640 RepID=A0ACC1WX69_MELAZ|nr:G-type lectin S-receptor-like serine/threonine-protein kinase [Melia azedarach]